MKLIKYITLWALAAFLLSALHGCGSKQKEDSFDDSIKNKPEHEAVTEQNQEGLQENGDTKEPDQPEPKSVTADYSQAFQSISGCAVIYDEAENVYTYYNEELCKKQASPYSTFKIISTLMGLHKQVVSSEHSKMEYNGTTYPIESWNADLDLGGAFQNSCVWYFRQLTDRVGKEEVQKEVSSLNYGNCDISQWEGSNSNPIPELNGFWLDSSLKISPQEQVDVLRNIIEGKTIYTSEEVNILKDIMNVQTEQAVTIYGKTGTGQNGEAWFVGLKETQQSNIYFAIYLNDGDSNEVNGAKAKEIALTILSE